MSGLLTDWKMGVTLRYINIRMLLFIILLLIISLAESKTIHADVTDDGINDKIIMGLESVVVVNKFECCKRRRHTLVSDVECLVDIMVNDFHHGIRGKEIAVVMLPDSNCVTEIYGFKNNQFKKISEPLPGKITFDDTGYLFGYYTHMWEGGAVHVPYPIIQEDGFLKPATIELEIETTIVIEANTVKKISTNLSKNTLVVCVATAQEKDVIIFLQDEDGSLITQRKIDSKAPLVSKTFADKDKTITLIIDNLQSTTLKRIYYIIKHYAYKP